MKRFYRILLEIFGPPLLGALGINLLLAIQEPELFDIRLFLGVHIAGMMFALPLSVAYAGVMELAFYRGLRPDSWKTVALSGALGAVAGAIIRENAWPFEDYPFMVIGLLTGVILGLVLRFLPPTFLPKATMKLSRGGPP